MQIDQSQQAINATMPGVKASGRLSCRQMFRQWAPYVLTALIVPGGLIVAILLLARRWQQHRQMTHAFSPGQPA